MTALKFHDPEVRERNSHLMTKLLGELRSFAWSDVSCCVCGARSDEDAVLVKWGVEMRRCAGCEHLYVTPRLPREAVPALYGSAYWDEYARSIGSPTLEDRVSFDHANGRYKLHRDVLPFRSSGRLLDVGASSGGFVRQAVDAGFQAEGLEPTAEICALARRTHGVEMHAGTLAEQRFADASWEIVTLHDVLEHVFEPVEELREIRRVLRPGGLLVVETPTTSSRNYADEGLEWPTISPLEHVHLFDEGNAARILRATGFQIVDLYSPHEDNWIAIAEAA